MLRLFYQKSNSDSCVIIILTLSWIIVAPSITCLEYVSYTDNGNNVSRVCGDIDINTTVPLSCPPNTLFRVIGKEWSDNVPASFECNNTTNENKPDSSATYGSSGSPPLSSQCRGQTSNESSAQLCNETVQMEASNPGRIVKFYEVAYECVQARNVHNMCDEKTDTTITDKIIHLASPSLLSTPPEITSNNTCVCTLSTSDRHIVHLLYVDLSTEDWNVTCNSCSVELPNFNRHVVNFLMLSDLKINDNIRQYKVKFNDDSNNELWLKFQLLGNNGAILQCNGKDSGLLETTTSPVSSSETSNQTTTDVLAEPSGSKNFTFLVVGVVLGVVFLVLIVVVIIILRKRQRRRSKDDARNRTNNSSHPHENGGKEFDSDLEPQTDCSPDQSNIGISQKNDATDKNVYFILEPDSKVRKERGVVFITDREGHDLVMSPVGEDNNGPMTADHVSGLQPEVNSPDTIKIIDKSKSRSSSRHTPHEKQIEDNTTRHYEDVVPVKLDESNKPSLKGNLKPKSFADNVPEEGCTLPAGIVGNDVADSDWLMVDNVAYESADKVVVNPGETVAQFRNYADHEELVMVDNPDYQTVESLKGKG